MDLNGTETLKNLARSFAGESQAKNRYSFYAEQLKKEGYEYLYKIISEIEQNEHAHARIFFNYITNNSTYGYANIDFDAGYPFQLGDSLLNLAAAAEGENAEATDIYPKFAKIAREEGFPELGAIWDMIAKVESGHNQVFTRMKMELENKTIYKKAEPIIWRCQNCGYEYTSKDAMGACPLCKYPIGWNTTPLN